MILSNIDASAIAFLLIAFLFVAVIIAIPVTLCLIFYKWLARRGYRYLGITILLSIVCFVSYNVYTAIYPTDSFYYEEFEKVTLRKIPSSAIIINKEASYPDFHGDYCSGARIQLSAADYKKLLKEVDSNKRLTKSRHWGSAEFDKVMGELHDTALIYEYQRNIKGKEDLYLFIGFINDGRTIIISMCAT